MVVYFSALVFQHLSGGWSLLLSHLSFHCCASSISELSPEERSQYELICLDGTTKPIEEYQSCSLARVPAHAVVARATDGRIDEILAFIAAAQVFPPRKVEKFKSKIFEM